MPTSIEPSFEEVYIVTLRVEGLAVLSTFYSVIIKCTRFNLEKNVAGFLVHVYQNIRGNWGGMCPWCPMVPMPMYFQCCHLLE